jgi:hypothetical protein
VVEAEIRHKYGLPVSFDPSTLTSEFLVLSFGHCKFKLTEASTAVLQSVTGGIAANFCLLSLGGRVFRFSVSSQVVGFHIYSLRSFECTHFKLYFNLWRGGSPKFTSEFSRWEADEAAQWTTVAKKQQTSPLSTPLIGVL